MTIEDAKNKLTQFLGVGVVADSSVVGDLITIYYKKGGKPVLPATYEGFPVKLKEAK